MVEYLRSTVARLGRGVAVWDVAVGTVVGFPHGSEPLKEKVAAAEGSVGDGADEVEAEGDPAGGIDGRVEAEAAFDPVVGQWSAEGDAAQLHALDGDHDEALRLFEQAATRLDEAIERAAATDDVPDLHYTAAVVASHQVVAAMKILDAFTPADFAVPA